MTNLELRRTDFFENCTVDVFSTPVTEIGASLGLAVLIAVISKKYDFECLKIYKGIEEQETEPLIFKRKKEIVLKDICEKVTDLFSGSYGSCYLQMSLKGEEGETGILFLNDGSGKLGAAYNCKNPDVPFIERTRDFLDRSYAVFLDNKDTILKKISLPEIEEEKNP